MDSNEQQLESTPFIKNCQKVFHTEDGSGTPCQDILGLGLVIDFS
jgi:hypothetical protein